MKTILTQELAKELFTYVPETGALLHRTKIRGRNIGDRAGAVTTSRKGAYRIIKGKGFKHQASWIVWLYHTGAFPKNELDHSNLLRTDDRFENLREATRSQNCINRNRKLSRFGFRGVKLSHGRYSASLVKEQKQYYFGRYDTPEEAARAYDAGAKIHFGEFAIFNFPDTPQRDWLYVATDHQGLYRDRHY